MKKILILTVLGFISSAVRADIKKTFLCNIKQSKYAIELTYLDSDQEIPTGMRVSEIVNARQVLKMAGAPVVNVDYIWEPGTKEGSATYDIKEGSTSYDISLNSQTARSRGYTIFLNVNGQGKIGFSTNEMWSANPAGNCSAE